MLRITVHDEPRDITFQVEGMLTGPWAQELVQCWQGALASQPGPIICVDLTGVTSIDEEGKACLAALHRLGAEFIAADCVTEEILDQIARSAEQGGIDPNAGKIGREQ